MKKIPYSAEMDISIYEHEDRMLDEYSHIIGSYKKQFAMYGCSIQLDRYWNNFYNDEVSLQRLPFENGYICAISCNIERNGKSVCIDAIEGNILTASWTISSISKKGHWYSYKRSYLELSLFSDTYDVIEDLDSFLSILKGL